MIRIDPARYRLPPNITLEVASPPTSLEQLRYIRDPDPCQQYVAITGEWPDLCATAPLAEAGICYTQALIRTSIRIGIPWGATQDIVDQLIFDAVQKLWMHELHEHFLVNGEHFIEPHPPGGFN